MSHHPPVSAFHVSNRKDGFCISGSITAKSRFYGEGLPWAPRTSRKWGGAGLPDWVVPKTSLVAMCMSLPASPSQGPPVLVKCSDPGVRQSPAPTPGPCTPQRTSEKEAHEKVLS